MPWTPRVCDIEDCDRGHYARGWCQMHYSRWMRLGYPERPVPGWGKGWVCDCDPAIYAGGWYRVCETCGLPIVALMSDVLRERMAIKAPESVTQQIRFPELAA